MLPSNCPQNHFRKKLSAGTGMSVDSLHALYEFFPFMYQHIPVCLVCRCPRVIPQTTAGTADSCYLDTGLK